jgi:hypothetical protein
MFAPANFDWRITKRARKTMQPIKRLFVQLQDGPGTQLKMVAACLSHVTE